jgi:phosphatidylethanolamine/phosphatidyl-N-methylethanolamine N-methyltransferase
MHHIFRLKACTRAKAKAKARTKALPVFVATALRRPAVVGAACPSSQSLAEVLAEVVPRRGRPTVVELGAGTGAISAEISRRLPAGGRQVAVEIDPHLADHLERTHPHLTVVRGDAANLDMLLANTVTPPVDAVISGLPWSLFPEDTQRRILAQICRRLSPGAGFSTFAYLHALPLAGARRFRQLLHTCFDDVVVTRAVWRNLPPALAYLCRHPRSDS